MNTWGALGWGTLICSLTMLVAWVVAVRLNFFSLVDAVWAYGMGLVVLAYALMSEGVWSKRAIALATAMIWALRLGTHLALRLRAHYPQEDRRYQALKAKWSPLAFLGFFEFQAASQVLFTLPMLLLIQDPSPEISVWTVAGFFVFILALAGESLADWQLSQFRRQTTQGICQVGLWRYSRHPNYFFEWLVWCGISLMALGAPGGPLGLISPILMFLTLNYFTGVPAAEKQSIESRGDAYREYQRRTNAFFPGVPR